MEEPLRILPKEERIKNDMTFMISKYAESFVEADQLRKQMLLEDLNRSRSINDSQLELETLKYELNVRNGVLQKLTKDQGKLQERNTRELHNLRKQIKLEKEEKNGLLEQMKRFIEKEKVTRERIFGYIEDEEADKPVTDEERRIKDRLASYFDGVLFSLT